MSACEEIKATVYGEGMCDDDEKVWHLADAIQEDLREKILADGQFMEAHRRLVEAANAMRERVTALLLHQMNAGPVGLLGHAAQQSVLEYDAALSRATNPSKES